MKRHALLLGPALMLLSCAAAMAQDGAASAPAMDPAYLLGLGPIGALVWGAYLLGKGVNITLTVSLADEDRKRLDKLITAVEGKVAA